MMCESERDDKSLDMHAAKGGIGQRSAIHCRNPTITDVPNGYGFWDAAMARPITCQDIAKPDLDAMEDRLDQCEDWQSIIQTGTGD
jgi:hypothetical protein